MNTTRRELILIAGGTLTTSLLAWITADPEAAGQLTHGHRIGEAAITRLGQRVRTCAAWTTPTAAAPSSPRPPAPSL